MVKAKRPKAKKSDQPLEEDLSAENLEPAFAVSDSKITVRRDGGKVVVSVPVRFYARRHPEWRHESVYTKATGRPAHRN